MLLFGHETANFVQDNESSRYCLVFELSRADCIDSPGIAFVIFSIKFNCIFSFFFFQGSSDDHYGQMKIGLWIMAGLLTFMIIEKIFMEEERCREIVDAKTVRCCVKLR